MSVEQALSIGDLTMRLAAEASTTIEERERRWAISAMHSLGILAKHAISTKDQGLYVSVGMLGIAVIGLVVDGNFALWASEGLGFVGGGLLGYEWKPVSKFTKAKEHFDVIKKIKNQKEEITPEDIEGVFRRFPDVIPPQEIEIWLKEGKISEKYKNPGRRHTVAKSLQAREGNVDIVERKVIDAQILAEIKKRSPKHICWEIARGGMDALTGAAIILAVTNGISFGLGHPSASGFASFGDDAILWGLQLRNLFKEKIAAVFNGF